MAEEPRETILDTKRTGDGQCFGWAGIWHVCVMYIGSQQ